MTEPVGGAHRERKQVMAAVSNAIVAALESLSLMDGPALKKNRREKFLAMGKTGLS